MLTTLTAALSLAASLAIDVPYLPQTDALCGGAAAAMVFRYWGDTHADVQQFAPLVDRRAGGIANDVLTDAIRSRGWRTAHVDGSLEALEARVRDGQPVIVLLPNRGNLYHYVVVTAVREDAIVVHDPAWGPSRSIRTSEFERAWQAARYWSLVIRPPDNHVPAVSGLSRTVPEWPARRTALDGGSPIDACDARLNRAVDDDPRARDRSRGRATGRCPERVSDRGRAAPRIERRPLRPAPLARRLDPRARRAPSRSARRIRTGRPRIQPLHAGRSRRCVAGVESDRQAPRQPGPDRRSAPHALPDRRRTAGDPAEHAVDRRALRARAAAPRRAARSRGHAPRRQARSRRLCNRRRRRRRARGVPASAVEWAGTAARAATNREIATALPGADGQGDVWSASWRWWSNRPGVTVGFAAPRVGGLPGVWRFEGAWQSDTYRRHRRHRKPLSRGRTAAWRSATGCPAASDIRSRQGWIRGAAAEKRCPSVRRSSASRSAIACRCRSTLRNGRRINGGIAFRSIGAHAIARSSVETRGWVVRATAGFERVSDAAPFALWPGAGEGQVRGTLLRAHPLLSDGVVDARSSVGIRPHADVGKRGAAAMAGAAGARASRHRGVCRPRARVAAGGLRTHAGPRRCGRGSSHPDSRNARGPARRCRARPARRRERVDVRLAVLEACDDRGAGL